jgi:hypothetical protein
MEPNRSLLARPRTDVSGADDLVRKIGRVTGRVRAGAVGEVLLALHSGTMAFFAQPAEADADIGKNRIVLVVDYNLSTRTVYVVEDPLVSIAYESLAPPPV